MTKPHLFFICLFSFTTTPMSSQPSEYSVSCVHLHSVQKCTHKQLLKQSHFNPVSIQYIAFYSVPFVPSVETSLASMHTWMHSHSRMHTTCMSNGSLLMHTTLVGNDANALASFPTNFILKLRLKLNITVYYDNVCSRI